MARRTRRPSVVWLPISTDNRIGTDDAPASAANSSAFGITALSIPPFSPDPVIGDTALVPVVKDEPQGVSSADTSLSDLEGSAYRLRRIVGKIYVQASQVAAVQGQPTDFIVTAGFIILRVDSAGVPLNAGIGSDADYSPANLDSTRDPWIWRRTWRVANNAAQVGGGAPIVISPASNVMQTAGGVMDGPHVDAKTARVVSDEERLFLVLNGIALDGEENSQELGTVLVITDLRVLASMRKQSGNRRNASR